MNRRRRYQTGGVTSVTTAPTTAAEEEEVPLWKELLAGGLGGLGGPFGGGILPGIGSAWLNRLRRKKKPGTLGSIGAVSPVSPVAAVPAVTYRKGGIVGQARGAGKATRGNAYKHC